MGNLSCPDCESTDLRPSQRLAAFNWFFRIFGRQPYRCLCCYKRFFLPKPREDESPRPETGVPFEEAAGSSSPSFRSKALSAAHRLAPAMKYVRYAPILVFAAVCVYFVTGKHRPRPSNPLSLAVQGRGGQVRIAWDRTAAAVQNAPRGSLEISEADGTTRIELDKDLLRTGTVAYARKSQNVVVHMQVGDVEETAAFVSAAPPEAEDAQALREAEAARSKLDEQAAQIKRLEQIVEMLDHMKTPPTEPAASNVSAPAAPLKISAKQKIAAAPSAQTNRNRRDAAPAQPKKQMEIAKIERPAQNIDLRQNPPRAAATVFAARVQPAPVPLLTAPAMDEIASPLPIASKLIQNFHAPAAPAAPPAGAHPRSGILIWTGRLSKNEIITIDGRRPSIGALTGEVPGFPVRVNVYPANLTSDGLTVYTADPKFPADYSEPPGPKNGWNRTSYLQDPRRARSVTVLEPPRSENGWKRLVLQAGAAKVSVVLVEWGAISN